MFGTNAIAGSNFNTGLWYSSNSGQSWTQSDKTDNYFKSVCMVGTNAIAGSSSGTGLWYSSNSGQSWTQSPSVTTGDFLSVYMVGSNAIAGSYSSKTYLPLPGSTSVSGLWYSINAIPSIVCFKEGSKILTSQGYKPIETLRKGDLVKTFKNDYVPINMIGKRDIYHLASGDRIKDQLYKCSPNEYTDVWEDLIITGCHSILVDGFVSEEQKNKVIEVNGDIYVTDRKYRLPACVDDRACVYDIQGTYTIYHLALENDDYYMNYGIYANGLLIETCSKRYLKELANMELIE
jgi:hypothetical protein